MNYRIATVTFFLLFNTDAVFSETLAEKLEKAYDAGYKAGFVAGRTTPGGSGSLRTGQISGNVGSSSGKVVLQGQLTPGSRGYELPQNFSIQGIGNKEPWNTAKIIEQLQSGKDVQIQGYVFDENQLIYGKSDVFLDPGKPGKAFISAADGISSGKWVASPKASDLLSIGEVLELQLQGAKQGIVFEGVANQ